MTDYAEGKLVRLTGTFTDSAGTPVDPTTVNITVCTPSDIATTYAYGIDPEVVKTAVGVYNIDIDTTAEPGLWLYRWWSTGTGQSATTNDYFRVLPAKPVTV